MKLVLALVVLGACGFDPYGEPWDIRVGLPAQPVTRADLGVRDTADLAAGDVWVSLHTEDGGDMAYGVVGAGQPLYLVSAFEASAVPFFASHGALVFPTRLSDDPELQHATLEIAVHGPHAPGTGRLVLELDVPVGMICDPPPAMVRGRIHGCLGQCASGENDLVRAGDGTYLVGPFHLSLAVLDHMCQEAS